MRGEGDYINWYCSGINMIDEPALEQSEWNMLTQEQQTVRKENAAYVGESTITDELREDLFVLGWNVVE
jgi:hypothetical protein